MIHSNEIQSATESILTGALSILQTTSPSEGRVAFLLICWQAYPDFRNTDFPGHWYFLHHPNLQLQIKWLQLHSRLQLQQTMIEPSDQLPIFQQLMVACRAHHQFCSNNSIILGHGSVYDHLHFSLSIDTHHGLSPVLGSGSISRNVRSPLKSALLPYQLTNVFSNGEL